MIELTYQAVYILLRIMFSYDESFQDARFNIDDFKNVYCLSANVYHEARGETQREQQAVSQVVLNRVVDPRWPNNVCDVITQAKLFSWYADDMSNDIHDMTAWTDNVNAVLSVYTGISEDIVQGATHYYAHKIIDKPAWAEGMTVTIRLDGHTYLK